MTATEQTPAHRAAPRKAQAAAALLLTMFFWGTSSVFMRTTALSLSPENSLALRYLLLAALMAAGLAVKGSWRIARPDWPRLLIAALAGLFGSSWFVIEGFSRVAAGLGTVVHMVEPIIISLLAWAVLRESPSPRLWLGLAISLAGAAVLFWPDLSATTSTPVNPRGVLYLLCASTCWAIYTISAKPLLHRYSSFTVTAWTMLIAAVPIVFLANKPLLAIVTETPARPWAEIVYLAIFNSLLGTVLWNFGSRHLPGAAVGSFLYLLPVVAVVAGSLMLDEPITSYLVSGGSIILAGVALAQSSSAH